MATNYIQPGERITWTNGTGSDVSRGDVVALGEILAIAMVDIPDGETGELATEGVFECPKVSGAVIGQGETVIWDVSVSQFDDNAATPASGDVSNAAVAWEAAGNGETVVRVKLQNPGSVT